MPVWKKEPGYWRQSERRKLRDRRPKTSLTALAIWTNWGSARKRLGIRLQRTSKSGSLKNTTRPSLLTDLHDLSKRRGHAAAFQTVVEKLRRTHAAKESFLRRLSKAKL